MSAILLALFAILTIGSAFQGIKPVKFLEAKPLFMSDKPKVALVANGKRLEFDSGSSLLAVFSYYYTLKEILYLIV